VVSLTLNSESEACHFSSLTVGVEASESFACGRGKDMCKEKGSARKRRKQSGRDETKMTDDHYEPLDETTPHEQ